MTVSPYRKPKETSPMQIDLRTVSITPLRQTYNHIAERLGAKP